MAKNPQWPCYYNDLRGSTQDWTDEEFGAYVRLLIYHWDKGFVPDDPKRIAKISDSANAHWDLLSEKFEKFEPGKLINKKAVEVKEKSEKHSKKQKENIDNRWNKNTKPVPNEYQTKYQTDTKKIPLENEYENENEIKEGGVGETHPEDDPPKVPEKFIKGAGVLIVPEFLSVWMDSHPDYVANPNADYGPIREIAEMIAAAKGIDDISKLDATSELKKSFKSITDFVVTAEFYRDYQLSQVAKYFNNITSKMRSAKTGVKKNSIINNNISASNGARDMLRKSYQK